MRSIWSKPVALSGLSCLLGLLLPGTAAAASYSESISGDLSGDRALPTVINLDPGANAVAATSVAGDREYFRLVVPTGFRISAITLTSYSATTNVAFIAVQSGPVFTEPPTPPGPTNVAQLLGYAHFGTADVGTDILDNIGQGSGAIGFTGALGQPSYTFWSQETAGSPSSYTLTFSVTAVPAAVPALGIGGTVALGAVLLGLVAVRRGRRA